MENQNHSSYIKYELCLSPSFRWSLPSSARSLPPPDAGTDGPRSGSLCPHGGSHGDRPGSSRSSHHRDRAAGRDVPDLTGADRVSALSAGNRHPHLPRCGTHEHTLLPILLLCRVSRAPLVTQAAEVVCNNVQYTNKCSFRWGYSDDMT